MNSRVLIICSMIFVAGYSLNASAENEASPGASPSPQSSSSVSPASAKKFPSLFQTCRKGRTAFSNELKSTSDEIEAWAKTKKSEELATTDFVATPEGRSLRLFAPYLLPVNSPFLSAYKNCWVEYFDFKNALAENKVSDAQKAIGGWKVCVEATSTPFPEEATRLLTCWDQVRK